MVTIILFISSIPAEIALKLILFALALIPPLPLSLKLSLSLINFIPPLSAMIGELMSFHFSHHDQEYFVFGCVIETQEEKSEKDNENQEILIAVNHRYHDIASLALILKGADWPIKLLVPDGVKKRTPHPRELEGFNLQHSVLCDFLLIWSTNC